jgi:hypothetical protein
MSAWQEGDPAMRNCYNCWDLGPKKQCYGCFCLPCLLGENGRALLGRSYNNDFLCSCLCAENNIGAGFINMKQREVLSVARGDEFGYFLCTQCVACDTARLIEQERITGNTRGFLKAEPAQGMTERRLLAPVQGQPAALH